MQILKILLFSMSTIFLALLSMFFWNNGIHLDWGKKVTFNEKITKVVLDNGMSVLIMQDKSIPKVLMQIAYDVGSIDEQEGEKGLAHLIEHMIFKGTKILSETDINAIARKYGASFNAFTYQDATSYYFETDSSNWKPFLGLLSDCMENARFDPEHLASEVKAVVSELKMGRDDNSRVMFAEAFKSLFPTNNPYSVPIIGYKEDLLSLSSEKLKKFYKKYYKPNKAVLFIVGDVDQAEVLSEVKKNFEKIDGGTAQLRNLPHIPKDLVSRESKIYRVMEKPVLGLFWRIPGLKEKHDLLFEALEFVLAYGEGGRLYKRLIDEDKIANSVTAGASEFLEAGVFCALVEPKDGKIDECRKVIFEEIQKLIQDGVTKEELQKMVNTKKRTVFQSLENYKNFVFDWLRFYFATNDEHYIFERLKDINKITSKQIQEIAKKFLDPYCVNEVQLLPVPEDKMYLLQEAQAYEDELDTKILSKQHRTASLEEPRFVNKLSKQVDLKFSFPRPIESTLKNGIKVLLHKNNRWPFFNLMIQFRDAPFFEMSKDSVLLKVLMEMLMEGSEGFSKNDNVNFFESRAVDYGFDASGVGICALSENYEEVFKRLLHIIQKPTFPQAALDKIRSILIDQFTALKKDENTVAFNLLKNLIYKDHPSYSWTIDGVIKELQGITIQDLVKAHKKYITPKALVISVVGNFDQDKMKHALEFFAPLTGEEYKPFGIHTKVVGYTPENVDQFMLRDQVVFMLGQPSTLTIQDPDLIPVRLLNIVAFSSLGSRVFNLREATGAFYTASGAFGYSSTKEHGFDYIYVLLSPDKIEEVTKVLKSVINDIAEKGIFPEELEVARKIYVKSLIDLSEKNSIVAKQLGRLEGLGLGFDYFDKALARVQNIKLEEVNRIAKMYFKTDKLYRVCVGRVGKQ